MGRREAQDESALGRVLRFESRGPSEADSWYDCEADRWYDLGCALEPESPELARLAYERALATEADHADAHTNLGRLLHERGHVREALGHYRRAVELAPRDATASFNLAVALEDLGDLAASARAYEATLALDPALVDAHANLALVRERLGDRSGAFRHYAEARRLSG